MEGRHGDSPGSFNVQPPLSEIKWSYLHAMPPVVRPLKQTERSAA